MSGQTTERPRRVAGIRPEVATPELTPRTPFALSWSGGKDSALTLWALRHQGIEPAALVTTVTEDYERISMHGVRRELLARQSAALGIPLVEVMIPPDCANDVYESRMAQAFGTAPLASVAAVAFGDLFLEDVRAYREQRLTAAGKRGLFPSGGAIPVSLRESSSAPASRRPLSASTRARSTPRSPDVRMTNSCWPSCLRPSTPAARTASSTPSSTPARSLQSRSPARPARSSSARASSSAT